MSLGMINEEIMIVLQIVLVVFILVGLLSLLRYLNTLKYEKRLRKYLVDDISRPKRGLFGNLAYRYRKLEKSLSKVLTRFKIFNKYSKKYSGYISRESRRETTSMDFVSRKIIISIAFVLTIIVSNVLRGVMFSVVQILCGLIIGFYLLDVFYVFSRRRDVKLIEEDLYKAISIMSNSFKAGKSMMQAISIVATEVEGPIKDEFSHMLTDLSYGLDDATVLSRFSRRVDAMEVRYLTTSLIILNKTGGDIASIFDTVERSVLAKKKLNQELNMLTSSSKLVFKILVSMPPLTSLLIYTFNPSYFNVLFTTSVGNIILGIIVFLYITYIFIIRRIMKVEGI